MPADFETTGSGIHKIYEPHTDHSGILSHGKRANTIHPRIRLPSKSRSLRAAGKSKAVDDAHSQKTARLIYLCDFGNSGGACQAIESDHRPSCPAARHS